MTKGDMDQSRTSGGPAIARVDVRTLFTTGREIILVHNDTEYRLRLTANDKLILTK